MNPVFQKLLQQPASIRPFVQWYNTQYPNGLAIFQDLPFSHQIGVYLEYFETIYHISITVSTKGYGIYFSDDRAIPLYNENNLTYNHYRFNHNEPKSIIYGYELGIQWLFKNYDLPF